MFAEGVPARVTGGRKSLRRDASLHTYLRFLGRRARRGNSRRTSRANDGEIEVRTFANCEGRVRSDDDQVHGFLSNEAALCVRMGRVADVGSFSFLRLARILDEVR